MGCCCDCDPCDGPSTLSTERRKIHAHTGVGRIVKDYEKIQGTPAIGYNDFNKSYVHFKNLPDLVATIQSLEKEIKALKEVE